jgi:hypothetical protein
MDYLIYNYRNLRMGRNIQNPVCHDEAIYGNAEYSSYWCVANENVPEQSGFLFGGLYTTAVSNPITQSKTCPLYFYPLNKSPVNGFF